jgi:hypothetical protein
MGGGCNRNVQLHVRKGDRRMQLTKNARKIAKYQAYRSNRHYGYSPIYDAEDYYQEMMLAIWRANCPDETPAIMFRVSIFAGREFWKHQSSNFKRNKHFEVDSGELLKISVPGVEKTANNHIMVDKIRHILEPEEFDLVWGLFAEERSAMELGRQHGVTSTTIANRADKIIKKVRRKLCVKF